MRVGREFEPRAGAISQFLQLFSLILKNSSFCKAVVVIDYTNQTLTVNNRPTCSWWGCRERGSFPRRGPLPSWAAPLRTPPSPLPSSPSRWNPEPFRGNFMNSLILQRADLILRDNINWTVGFVNCLLQFSIASLGSMAQSSRAGIYISPRKQFPNLTVHYYSLIPRWCNWPN